MAHTVCAHAVEGKKVNFKTQAGCLQHTHTRTHTPKAAADPGDDCVQLELQCHFAFRVPLICLQSLTDISSIVILTTASYHELHCTEWCCVVLAKGFNQYLWVLLKWKKKISTPRLLYYCNSQQIKRFSESAALNANVKTVVSKRHYKTFRSLLNWFSFQIHFCQNHFGQKEM